MFRILLAMTERASPIAELFSEPMVIRSQDVRPSLDNNAPSTDPSKENILILGFEKFYRPNFENIMDDNKNTMTIREDIFIRLSDL